MNAPANGFAAILRGAGLRVTTPRLAVLAALAECPPHVDAGTTATAVRARTGGIASQTVYNVLWSFLDAGLLRRIQPAGSPGRYELRVGLREPAGAAGSD